MVLKTISPGCGVRASLMLFFHTLSIYSELIFKTLNLNHKLHFNCASCTLVQMNLVFIEFLFPGPLSKFSVEQQKMFYFH